jgi:cyclopropane fatty-acyl-phospholipid synthase-like methyltransferase
MSIAANLVGSASEPYRACSRFAYRFARAKLTQDPVFSAILTRGLLTDRERILDLGCGQGLLAACLLASGSHAKIRGIELQDRYVERARRAWGLHAEFERGDVRTVEFGRVDGVVILDVLHYIDYENQCGILRRARTALSGGGVLLLRVGDAGGGWRFEIAKWVDHMTLLMSGRGWGQLHCRSSSEWRELLTASGFDSEVLPMSRGTPFANVLLIATPR